MVAAFHHSRTSASAGLTVLSANRRVFMDDGGTNYSKMEGGYDNC